jgi:hypothetical protein
MDEVHFHQRAVRTRCRLNQNQNSDNLHGPESPCLRTSQQNRKEPLRMYEQCGHRIDLLISDVVMPRMRGPELAVHLRRHQPEIHIIRPHVTACGQMTVGEHSEALPPAAFRIKIPVTAMRIPGSYPYRMGTWRLFPPARLPVIGVAVIAVIPTYPDMFPAWAGGAMLMDANRGPKFYDDLSISRYPKRKAKQRRKN